MSLDTLLVIRAQSGDRGALNDVLRELQEPLYAHIAGVLGHTDGADDVLQDVLLIIARKLGSVREPKWARAWAYRIANREAVRAARRTRHHEELTEYDVAADDPGEDHPADLPLPLPELLDTLPAGARSVIRLHYIEDLSLVEIAEALELQLGTVKSRLAYGLKVLRASIHPA